MQALPTLLAFLLDYHVFSPHRVLVITFISITKKIDISNISVIQPFCLIIEEFSDYTEIPVTKIPGMKEFFF